MGLIFISLSWLVLVLLVLGVIVYYIMNTNLNETFKAMPNILVQCALGLGIIIITNVLVFNVAQLFITSPEWNQFCGQASKGEIRDKDLCEEMGGEWNGVITPVRTVDDNGAPMVIDKAVEEEGWCDQHKQCNEEFAAARNVYNRDMFATGMIIGIIILILGAFVVRNKVVAISLILASILNFLIYSIGYWSDANRTIRVVLLAIVLLVLLGVVLKKDKKVTPIEN